MSNYQAPDDIAMLEETDIRMDNSGTGKLQVPGFNDVPLMHELPIGERFTHGIHEYAQVPAITARELAMTATMNWVTDQPGWSDAFVDNNEEVIAVWKAQAFEREALMSDNAWDWCLAELRDKAMEYRETGFVRVLDTGSCVCKTDMLVDESVCTALRDAFRSLHPLSKATPGATSLVNPYLNPLVYGETRVCTQGTIGLPKSSAQMDDIMLSASQLTMSEGHLRHDFGDAIDITEEGAEPIETELQQLERLFEMEMDYEQYFYSHDYQCLPCDVQFDETKSQLKISSYINDLHPSQRRAYQAIETVMTSSIQLWNACLIKGHEPRCDEGGCPIRSDQTQRGRFPLRILTFGVEWSNTLPVWARSFMKLHDEALDQYLKRRAEVEGITRQPYQRTPGIVGDLEGDAYLEGMSRAPEPTEETWKLAEEYLGYALRRDMDDFLLETLIREEADRRRRWTHPDAGVAFSYEDWESGKSIEKMVVNMIIQPLRYVWPDLAPPDPPAKGHSWPETSSHFECERPLHQRYDVDLRRSFEDRGLQMIVKVDSIVLDGTGAHTGEWRLEGQRNEHIVGVACYMFDVVNADVQVSFNQEVEMNRNVYRWRGEDQKRCTHDNPLAYQYDSLHLHQSLDAFAKVFAFDGVHTLIWEQDAGNNTPPAQAVGTVKMPQGRLIVFPNVLEYKMEASLIDKELGHGHARYLTICLVDPHYRVCSTSNVPPQQSNWWAASIGSILRRKGLPQELVEEILLYYEPPMTRERARRCAKEMQEESNWIRSARHACMSKFEFDPVRYR